jgi:hypothetical protein
MLAIGLMAAVGCVDRDEEGPAAGAVAGESQPEPPVPTPVPPRAPAASVDRFGIRMLYPTGGGRREWTSRWDTGIARTFGNTVDPHDPEFHAGHGSGTYRTDGQGILKIGGQYPRMYVHDPALQKSWTNVEITVYGRRVSDTGISWAGIMAYARTNHGTIGDEDVNLADCRGYGGMMAYPGTLQFEKETAHHLNDGYAQVQRVKHWAGGMPLNVWIGYKFVVRDVNAGRWVRLELWVDERDGADGGDWKKVVEFTDNGQNFGVGYGAAKPELDPALPLTSSDARPGSETGKPNITVYFRSDGVNADGLWYKRASIREIDPLP